MFGYSVSASTMIRIRSSSEIGRGRYPRGTHEWLVGQYRGRSRKSRLGHGVPPNACAQFWHVEASYGRGGGRTRLVTFFLGIR